jgi:uncharacterized NAD(P)/FAD-binding protein YdhS
VLSVAIIGAGFSGTMTAVHLLRRGPGVAARVHLFDRSGRFGPGLAYSTPSAVHFLNVPAGNMSALDDDPGHFLRWAQGRDPSVGTGSFLARGEYGLYLSDVLLEAQRAAGPRLALHPHGVTGVTPVPGERPGETRWRVDGDHGEHVIADRVVLAFGNAPPRNPPVEDHGVFKSAAYVRDPWSVGALKEVRADEPVLIVGTGLTMMDVVMQLHAQEHEGRIWALSRHGLLSRPHRSPSRPPTARKPPEELGDGWDGSAKVALRAVRRAVREHAAKGTDWRDVITSLRPVTGALWARMPEREAARFLSRLRSYWDVVRHRAAPETAACVADLIAARQLVVRAGRLVEMRPAGWGPDGRGGGGVEVAFRPRGSGNVQRVRVARVINCMGPETSVAASADPVQRGLVEAGLVTPDRFGLGLVLGPRGEVIGRDGRPTPGVFAVGPVRRAMAWEATAVPELRKHAAQVAGAV